MIFNPERLAQRELVAHLRTTKQQVHAKPTQGMFNQRCHDNCLEWLRTHADRKLSVVECIIVEDNLPVLHYVVRDGEELLEVTLGWRATRCEYYVIRDLLPADHDVIYNEFNRGLRTWTRRFRPWWAPWVTRCL